MHRFIFPLLSRVVYARYSHSKMNPAEWDQIVQDTEPLISAVQGNTPLFENARVAAARTFLDRYGHHLRWHQFEVTLYTWDPPYRGNARARQMTHAKHNMIVV